MLVAKVNENSVASKAGLKAGDVIVAIDNEKIDNVNTLVNTLRKKEEGSVALKIIRNRVEQTINVTLEKRQPPTARPAPVLLLSQGLLHNSFLNLISDSNASGNEDTAIALSISSALTDTDGRRRCRSTSRAFRPAPRFNRGTLNGDGSWTLTRRSCRVSRSRRPRTAMPTSR